MRGASTVSTYRRPARAGSLRHRILAARGGQAAAHAEAEDRWPAASRWSPAAPAASAARRPRGCCARAPAWCSPTSTRRRSASADAELAQALTARTSSRGVSSTSPTRTQVVAAFAETAVEFGGLDILVSNAGIASSAPIEETDARAVEQEHGHPGDRLFPRLARGLPAVPRAEDRRQRRLHRLQERPRRLAQRRRLLHRQGGRDPPRPLPGAGRRGRAASASTSSIRTRCCAARRSGPASGASSAPPPTRSTTDDLEEHLPQALAAEALACSPRTSPRRSISSPPTCRPSRPATSSTSMPATRRALRAERRASLLPVHGRRWPEGPDEGQR